MELLPAVIALAVIAGIGFLVIIPALAIYICLLRRKSLPTHNSSSDESQLQKTDTRTPKQINSIPCRLKSKRNTVISNHGARSESGVYDMSDISSSADSNRTEVTATYPGDQKVNFYGDLTVDDLITVKAILCQLYSSAVGKQHNSSFSVESVVITGLSPATTTYVNESYQDDGEVKARKHSEATLSLGRKKKAKKLDTQISTNNSLNDNLVWKRTEVIGASGGTVTLDCGIKLIIPPNALSDNVDITLGVSFNPTHRPEFEADNALLSPIVFCAPLGLKLNAHATLTIPHNAENVHENWRANILSFTGEGITGENNSATSWKTLQIGEYESRTFNKTSMELCVNRLAFYCLSGFPKQNSVGRKRNKLIAASLDSSPTNFYVYCVNSYNLSARQADVLLIEPTKQAIKLSTDNIYEGWLQTNPHNNQISFTTAWQETLQPTLLEFSKKADGEIYHITFDVNAWQIGCGNFKYKLSVSSSTDCNKASIGVPRPKRQIFSETLKWDIMLLLDQMHPDGNDWRKLAEVLGVNESAIKMMEEKPSPTKELLKVWEEKGHGCIRSFVAMTVKIHRLDVAEKIEEHVGKLYLETLPNHKCDNHC